MHVTIGRNTGAGLDDRRAGERAGVDRRRPTPARRATQTTFSSVTTSVAGDASCGFPIVADPGLSGALVDTGGEFANYVPDVLTIPEGSPAEDAVAPCSDAVRPALRAALPGGRRAVRRGRLRAGRRRARAGSRRCRPRRRSRRSRHPRPHRRLSRRPSSARPSSSSRCAEPCSSARGGRRSARRCAPARRSRSARRSTRKRGTVELTSLSSAGGKPQKAKFSDGIFRVTQSGAYTELTLTEALATCSSRARTAQSKKPKSRKLWGDGKGKFRTKGRYAAATVRGTKWLVQDTCTTTIVRVTQGTRDRPRPGRASATWSCARASRTRREARPMRRATVAAALAVDAPRLRLRAGPRARRRPYTRHRATADVGRRAVHAAGSTPASSNCPSVRSSASSRPRATSTASTTWSSSGRDLHRLSQGALIAAESDGVQLVGAGARATRIDGANGESRVLHGPPARPASRVAGLTVSDGNAPSDRGGNILNEGELDAPRRRASPAASPHNGRAAGSPTRRRRSTVERSLIDGNSAGSSAAAASRTWAAAHREPV